MPQSLHISLRKMMEQDYEHMLEWRQDEAVRRYYSNPHDTYTLEKVVSKYSDRVKGKDKKTPIIIQYDERPVGYLQYYELDLEDKRANGLSEALRTYGMDIMIGSDHFRNKGIAAEAIRRIIKQLGETAKVDNIVLKLAKENASAVKCYENCGFCTLRDGKDGLVLMEYAYRKHFIGIVPPDAYKEVIVRFQNRWPSNRIMDVAEPHITVKAQGGLTRELDWLAKVRAACTLISPFELSLAGIASFGSSVVYMTVQSEPIFELHHRLVETIMPPRRLIEQYRELDGYEPHLTLGQTHWGMNEEELSEMKAEAAISLLPSNFIVDRLRVYQEIEPDQYVPLEDIPLGR